MTRMIIDTETNEILRRIRVWRQDSKEEEYRILRKYRSSRDETKRPVHKIILQYKRSTNGRVYEYK